MQAQRLYNKLYKQVQLQADQRAVMAGRWRSWCRQRRGLDGQLASALQQLQARLPLSSPVLSSVRYAVACARLCVNGLCVPLPLVQTC